MGYVTPKDLNPLNSMPHTINGLRHKLTTKVISTTGAILVASLSVLAYFAISTHQNNLVNSVVMEADRLSSTIKLGTHYAMMLNSRDDISQIIKNIGRQKDIINIRIYNKEGQIKFSTQDSEVDSVTNIKAEACFVCHRTDPPQAALDLSERVRISTGEDGSRSVAVLTPIYNEPGCSSGCHFHSPDKIVLGAIDLVYSLEATDLEFASFEHKIVGMTAVVLVATSVTIFLFMIRFIRQPIMRLMAGTREIALGGRPVSIPISQDDEIGELAKAITQMGRDIHEKQLELNRQRDEYQTLFSHVPCLITVQDRNYRLLRYNLEFAEKFKPKAGDYCYRAYKGRSSKCPDCPVAKTFKTGRTHISEESGLDHDGTIRHWLVTTSPIRDAAGEINSVMEVSLDITARKELERKLERSEAKYLAIFNNIPSAVFVLDLTTLKVLDCNESMVQIYGWAKEEIMDRPITDLFPKEIREPAAEKLRRAQVMSQVKNVTKDGRTIYVTMRPTPVDFPGQRVLLATSSDITKRLETEQHLIQASKMATLGEMATGVAHELNQPLSVIKTASSYFMRKIAKNEPIKEEILKTMAEEIDSHVDRATKIINHMREFGRKPEMGLEPVQLNDIIRRAFDIFSQQLKLREIEVTWRLAEDLPVVMGDAGRLEQVFINMLINARDAIEEKWAERDREKGTKRIDLHTHHEGGKVLAEVTDTGAGIPKGVLEKIFEPFFTTKKVGKGTGLGLSISYGIVQDCGGTIQAVSKEDQGTTFILSFPLPDSQ